MTCNGVYMRLVFCKHVSLELEKHAVSGSLLNVLQEKPVKIVKVQYTEA